MVLVALIESSSLHVITLLIWFIISLCIYMDVCDAKGGCYRRLVFAEAYIRAMVRFLLSLGQIMPKECTFQAPPIIGIAFCLLIVRVGSGQAADSKTIREHELRFRIPDLDSLSEEGSSGVSQTIPVEQRQADT
jgi:hypothetical protein